MQLWVRNLEISGKKNEKYYTYISTSYKTNYTIWYCSMKIYLASSRSSH